jgi:hypothetical protein
VSNIEETTSIILYAIKNLTEVCGEVGCSPSDGKLWHLRQAPAMVEKLIEYMPFKVGDRVFLLRDIDTTDAPGWRHWKNLLVTGSKAKVVSVGFYDDRGFYANLEFEDEKADRKHSFGINFRHLGKL